MYVLGHLGVTAFVLRRVEPRAALGLPLLLSLLPDLVDKPLRHALPELVNRNTRGFAHTVLAAGVVLAVLLALRRRVDRPWLAWACFVGHFALDRIWLHDNLKILVWPLLGGFPPPVAEPELSLSLLRYNLAGEALGVCLIAWLALTRRR